MSALTETMSKISLGIVILTTIIGFFGNLIVISIFSRPKFRQVSLFRYLIIASLSNLFSAILVGPIIFFQNIFFVNSISIICKLANFFFQFFSTVNAWVVVLGSIDRYLSIAYSKLQFRNQTKYQLLAISIIIISAVAVDVPFIFYKDVVAVANGTIFVCTATNAIFTIYVNIWHPFLATLIPFFLMLLTSILIAYQLIFKKVVHRKNLRKLQKDKKYVKLILSLDLYFLITNLPNNILAVVYAFQALFKNDLSFYGTITFYFLASVSLYFYLIYPSFDIIVYYSCNKLFREHFLSIFHFSRKIKK